MNIRPAFSALLALGFVTSVGTSSAVAAIGALPEGQEMYVISCDNGPAENPIYSGTLLSVDPSTGVLTPIGDGTPTLNPSGCAGQGAINPVDGEYYYLSWDFPGVDDALAMMDIETGLSTLVGGLTFGGAPFDNVYGIAIDSVGNAFTTATGAGRTYPGLYSVDLSDGTTTLVGEFTRPLSGYAVAFDNDDNLYVIDASGGNALLKVSTTDASIISESSALSDVSGIYTMAFDADGTLWMQTNVSLFSADLSDLSVRSELVDFTIVGSPEYGYFSESMVIVGGESAQDDSTGDLAATGANDLTMLAGIAAVGLVVAGLALQRARRAQA